MLAPNREETAMTPPSPSAPPRIFSAARQLAAFRRAVVRQRRPSAARFLFDDMREEVKERLSFMQFHPRNALIIGEPTGLLLAELRENEAAVELVASGSWTGDEPLGLGPFDLIVQDTGLALINDLPGALLHLRQVLRPGGLLIAGILGSGSLPALRKAMLAAEPERPHPRLHPQIDNRTASGLLQRAGFARQVVDTHELTVRYKDLATLLSDLRDQGLGNALLDPAPPLDRDALARAEEAFRALADDDGRVSEVFSIITLTAWRS